MAATATGPNVACTTKMAGMAPRTLNSFADNTLDHSLRKPSTSVLNVASGLRSGSDSPCPLSAAPPRARMGGR